ncbi:MAG: hypothetical protein WB439_09930 [Acidobacteriaceae bacterium]
MSLDGQLEKLSALYDEKSDGELLGLYERRDGLTEMAQQALTGVMRARRLSLEPDSGSGAGSGSDADGDEAGAEPEDTVEEGEVLVYLFHDAFEAREALRVMREAGIAHRMLDWHVVNPEMQISQTGVDLGLVVGRADVGRTGNVLKEQLGLFPEAEDVAREAGESLAVLSMFERGDALVAARALGEAGMTYLWRDGRDHVGEMPDEETVAIEVRAADVERAGQIVEDALAAL